VRKRFFFDRLVRAYIRRIVSARIIHSGVIGVTRSCLLYTFHLPDDYQISGTAEPFCR
jgi:hypothetical protein